MGLSAIPRQGSVRHTDMRANRMARRTLYGYVDYHCVSLHTGFPSLLPSTFSTLHLGMIPGPARSKLRKLRIATGLIVQLQVRRDAYDGRSHSYYEHIVPKSG